MRLKKPESVLVVIYSAVGQVLLLHRQDWPGFWQSVTGSLEAQETPAEAAARELKEETGLSLADGRLIDCQYAEEFSIYPRYQHRYPEGTTKNVEHVFCFELPQEKEIQISAIEHNEYAWVPKAQAIARALSNTNKKAIDQWVLAQEKAV